MMRLIAAILIRSGTNCSVKPKVTAHCDIEHDIGDGLVAFSTDAIVTKKKPKKTNRMKC